MGLDVTQPTTQEQFRKLYNDAFSWPNDLEWFAPHHRFYLLIHMTNQEVEYNLFGFNQLDFMAGLWATQKNFKIIQLIDRDRFN